MSRFSSDQEREMLLSCLPFSKPQKIEGAWVFGFEANTFYEDERASPAILERFTTPPDKKAALGGNTTLVFNPDIAVDGKLRVFQINFVGRRGKCPFGPEREIVVDQVLSTTLKGVLG